MKYFTEKQAWDKIIKIFIDFSKTEINEYKLDNIIESNIREWSYHKIKGICEIIYDLHQINLISDFMRDIMVKKIKKYKIKYGYGVYMAYIWECRHSEATKRIKLCQNLSKNDYSKVI